VIVSLLEVLQLIGYSLGAVLPVWMGLLLLRQRLGLAPNQRLLLGLALCMGGWHSANLVITLRGLLGLEAAHWTNVLRLADCVAVISITVCYSLLLHIHIHLWASVQARPLKPSERVRVFLSYIPCLFLAITVPRIWIGDYQPMLLKLRPFVTPFVIWIVYSLGIVSITELLIARRVKTPTERLIMRTLGLSFIGIAVLIMAALGFGVGRGTAAGVYLNTLANLGSLLPSALLAYYIYRYRYLELIIKESLIVATFAAVVLAIYLYGIRRIGEFANARFGLRAGAIEAILILALTLMAAPLRAWLEKRFHSLFERETALYRDVVARIGTAAGQYRQLPELLRFVESQTATTLSLRRVRIALRDHSRIDKPEAANYATAPHEPPENNEEWIGAFLHSAETNGLGVNDSALREHGFDLAYPLTLDDRTVGLMLVEALPSALTPDVLSVLKVLAGQVAIAIADCRLIEENVRLERKVAEGERLAALGQMAATVAHEVKNPLSAIKSIAQVMREDEVLSEQHARDLSLIVGETDRLSQSVSQLLSFASRELPAGAPARADDLVRSVVRLFRPDAHERNITLTVETSANVELDGVQTASVRDAISNLVLNALQASPPEGLVKIESFIDGGQLVLAVTDAGPGIATEVRNRIWEPFFTTKQRGTGLGLAIVRKRMEEVGGSARLAASRNGQGARFELRLPVVASHN
jgi:signal transduction histidine kinase